MINVNQYPNILAHKPFAWLYCYLLLILPPLNQFLTHFRLVVVPRWRSSVYKTERIYFSRIISYQWFRNFNPYSLIQCCSSAMADNSSINKRRRTAPRNCISIDDIPDALMHVAHYLSKPQQALFAIAVTSSPSSQNNNNSSSTSSSEWVPNTKSNVIISATSREQWQELDFGDIEKCLASKLTDDDVQATRAVNLPRIFDLLEY